MRLIRRGQAVLVPSWHVAECVLRAFEADAAQRRIRLTFAGSGTVPGTTSP